MKLTKSCVPISNSIDIANGSLPSVGLQVLSAGTVFLLLAAVTGNFSLAEASFSGYMALMYLIFIGSILAYSAFFI